MQSEKIFAERFTELIKNSNLTLDEIAKQIGLKSKGTISKYASGNIKNIKLSLIIKIANLFNVSPIWLYGLSDEKFVKSDEAENNSTKIPLIDNIHDFNNILSEKNIIGYENISKNLSDKNTFFALKVKDNSMADAILKDDIIIVEKQGNYENGDIVVIKENNNVIIRKIKNTDTGILLCAFNNKYENLSFSFDEIKTIPIQIIGAVRELRRNF